MAKDLRCCFESKIPLRLQLLILLVVCAVIFLGLAPGTINAFKDSISVAFEESIVVGNLHRSIASMSKVLKHEEEMMVANAVWDDMADATEEFLATNSSENFEKFFEKNLRNYGKWSDWGCGNLVAIYNRSTVDDEPVLVWSEYHAVNLDTFETDDVNVTATPEIFLLKTEESKKFVDALTKDEFKSSVGLIAVNEGVFSVACHSIKHVDPNDTPHGYLCRVSDIRRYLESIASGSGACLTFYNLADMNNTPDVVRSEFGRISIGKRSSDNKFVGTYDARRVVTDEWQFVPWPIRQCGPAELPSANSTRRTALSFRLASDFGLDDGKNGSNVGFAMVLDNTRELEPEIDDVFTSDTVVMIVFSLIIFIAYGTFTEFKVLRQLNAISKAAYKSLVLADEEYYNKPEKEDMENVTHAKNEILQMATFAAMTMEKNMKQYEKAKNDLVVEKYHSSLMADQLRLLVLNCCRIIPLFEDLLSKSKSNSNTNSSKRRTKRRSGVVIETGQILKENITFDRVLSDPFAIEMFKNFPVEDTRTGVIRYPARRGLLFLLSVLYYRSMPDYTNTQSRLDCIQGILDEFFDPAVTGSKSTKNVNDGSLGIPDSMSNTLVVDCSKCMSTRRPEKNVFDNVASTVREYLRKNIFPMFAKSPSFLIVRTAFAQRAKIPQKVDVDLDDDIEPEAFGSGSASRFGFSDSSSLTSSSTATKSGKSERKMADVVNNTDGTRLSHTTLNYITDTFCD